MWNRIKSFFAETGRRAWNAAKAIFKGFFGGASAAVGGLVGAPLVAIAVPVMFVYNDGIKGLPLGLLAGVASGIATAALGLSLVVLSPLIGFYEAAAWLAFGEHGALGNLGEVIDDLSTALEDASSGINAMRHSEAVKNAHAEMAEA